MPRKKKIRDLTIIGIVSIITITLSVITVKFYHFSTPGESLTPTIISQLSGLEGTFNDGVYKVELSRPNLTTQIDGIQITSEFGLSAWMTLSGTRRRAILLGDIPLRYEEVNDILRAVIEAGVSVPALHNRFLNDSERIMSLHLEGIGSQEAMATAMGKIRECILRPYLKTPKSINRSARPIESTLDIKTMETLLWKGEMKKGIFHVRVGRGTILAQENMGVQTGVNSWAEFAGSDEYAIVNGETASLENEVPFIINDLLDAKILITSIHPHMTFEKPRLIFIHFWGTGKLSRLTSGVKEAFWEKEHFQSQ